MTDKSALDIRQVNYEAFIIILTALSWFNTALLFWLRDPNSRYLVLRMEQVLTIFFLLDFLYRLNTAKPHRGQYFMKYGWLDLIGSFPFLRWLRALRVFKTLKYLREESGHFLREFISNRANTAALSVILAVILLFEFASIFILQAEALSPEANIETAGDAFWWVLVTVATVGYGDLYPVTPNGRFIASFVIVAGVGLFGILSGFLARNFLGGQSTAPLKSGEANTQPDLDPQMEQILAALKELRRQQAEARADQEDANEELRKRLTVVEKLLESKNLEEKSS
jgi:voltage-gated potassium channel